MSQIVLDFGSGNTCKNDYRYIKRMIDELKAIDTGKHEIIIKWQLWDTPQGENIKLDYRMFNAAYKYAKELGYQTTASVFDKNSLDFLLRYDIPFVKIACNKDLYWLIGELPRKIPVYVSTRDRLNKIPGMLQLACISKYPAEIVDYEIYCQPNKEMLMNISDHTKDLELFKKYKPEIIEMHYALEDSTGLDVEAGVCKTPKMLADIL